MQNRYPLWKNLLLIILFVIGLVYTLPVLFGDDPAVQISGKDTATITAQTIRTVKSTLQDTKLRYLSISREKNDLLVRFPNTTVQLEARDEISAALGSQYTAALNLAPRTPGWLQAIGAHPLKLGLDLRGGVHLLLNVVVGDLVKDRITGDIHSIGESLRDANIRYSGITKQGAQGLVINFRDTDNMQKAYSRIGERFPDYQLTKVVADNKIAIQAVMTQSAVTKANNYAIDQAMYVLNKRVNALGVSEAIVQRQGVDHISVDLPGIQDTARAKSIIGRVATVRFQMVDEDHDVQSAVAGDVPIGSKLYMDENKNPILLKDKVILRGDSITYATATFSQDGRPSVNVRLGGGGDIGAFNRITAENVGKKMATIYIETIPEQKKVNGKVITIQKKTEKIISVATIDSPLGANFEITGLESVNYARNLALLLRSGALPVPMNVVQELNIGPSLGAANIHMGLISIIIGFLLVVLFMALYYRFFGLVADMALFLNLIFIIAVFSLLEVTMTLPGIAAMVLTVGMAVDANVLINERIREELRNGISPQASIYIGYERAFITIVDSNVTTLIVAVVLFAIGTGSVKGFAVTLIVGLLTSMVTSIMYTRAVVNWVYGGKIIKRLSIGIRH